MLLSPRNPAARSGLLFLVALSVITLGCGGSEPRATTVADPGPAPDSARGGRLFDSWRSELARTDFEPDDSSTEGVADGRGGPNGDGTLALGDGTPLLNAGHDYRLKNLFGWDLRGRAGIYGPGHMDRAFALDSNLLESTGDASAIAERLGRGDEAVPAFGAVMDADALGDLAAFVVGVRDGALPGPDDLYEMTSPAAGHYALRAGGDAERGRALFAQRCRGCHGADGTAHLFDDGAYSLGSHSRQKAYEDWLKILNGQPGTPMGRQVRGTRAEMTQELLDLFAALCDRTAFPPGAATAADVADGDARCGAYLR